MSTLTNLKLEMSKEPAFYGHYYSQDIENNNEVSKPHNIPCNLMPVKLEHN